jgi:hypothetical protein
MFDHVAKRGTLLDVARLKSLGARRAFRLKEQKTRQFSS